MKSKILAAFFVACLAAVLVSFSEVNADHSWGSYHWSRTSNPLLLELGDNVDINWDTYLATASVDWSKSSVLNTFVAPGTSSARRCAITPGKVEVCNDTYGYNGWLGVAGISVSGSHITGSYVKLNDSYFNSPTYNTPAWRNLVMCQEVGHAFGLDHQDENFNNNNLGTCMDYTNNPEGGGGQLNNEHPNTHDYDQLEAIYSHSDGGGNTGGGCKGKGCNGKQSVDWEDPREWGRVIDRDHHGRPILYVRDLGNGDKHFTHIFPLPPSDDSHGNRR